MSKEIITAFLREMKGRYQDQIDSVALPDGTREYVEERALVGDYDTLMFMLRLGYLMGLQTGFAAAVAGEQGPIPPNAPGPLQA